MTTGKTIGLTRQNLVSKVTSLLFNMLSRFVIGFLPRSKYLSISWLQSPSTVILKPKKMKLITVSIVFPIYLLWSDGTGCHDLTYLPCNLVLSPGLSVTFVLMTSRFTSEFWALWNARLTNLIMHLTSPLEGLTDSSNIVYLKLSFQYCFFLSPANPVFLKGFPTSKSNCSVFCNTLNRKRTCKRIDTCLCIT